MGLDMYLERKKRNVEADAENAWEEVMYWRKANQIREWFVNNLLDVVENCKRTPVYLSDLEELVETCETVLADHSKAKELLPTSSGFFFGGTEYDEWYYQDLEETVEGLKRVIEETDWETEDVAYFEWW